MARAFITYVLSMDGQKLWNFKPGTPGGPARFALRRLPVRKDFYTHTEWSAFRSDPEADPFSQTEQLVYHPAWTGGIFHDMAFIITVMCQDTHSELTAAWRAVLAAPEPARSQALAALQDLSMVEYERVKGPIHRALGSRDAVDQVRLRSELGAAFRRNYARAEAIARGQ